MLLKNHVLAKTAQNPHVPVPLCSKGSSVGEPAHHRTQPIGKEGTWGPQGQAPGQGKGPQVPNLCTSLSMNELQRLYLKLWSCGTTLPSRNDQSNRCPGCE